MRWWDAGISDLKFVISPPFDFLFLLVQWFCYGRTPGWALIVNLLCYLFTTHSFIDTIYSVLALFLSTWFAKYIRCHQLHMYNVYYRTKRRARPRQTYLTLQTSNYRPGGTSPYASSYRCFFLSLSFRSQSRFQSQPPVRLYHLLYILYCPAIR